MQHVVHENVIHEHHLPVKAFVICTEHVAYHWHEEYELIGVLKGRLGLDTRADHHLLEEGDLCLVNSEELHALSSVDSMPVFCMIFQFSPRILGPGREDGRQIRFFLNSVEDEVPECGFPYLYRKQAALVDTFMSSSVSSPLRRQAAAMDMIADLFDYCVYDVRFQRGNVSRSHSDVQNLTDYLKTHLGDATVFEDACHSFGMSRRTMDRLLKSGIGITGRELLNDLRIQKARDLLNKTNDSMSEIMEACGFGSENTFYRTFREAVGMTPVEYRKRDVTSEYRFGGSGYLDYEIPPAARMVRKIVGTPKEGADGKLA